MKEPLISVISVNWNRRKDLLRMLSSMRKQTYKRVQFIVVDNASSDNSLREVRENFPEVGVIVCFVLSSFHHLQLDFIN